MAESKNEKKFLFTGRDPSNIKLPGRIAHYPLIETKIADFKIDDVGSYAGVIFTSRMAVKIFCGHYRIEEEQNIFAVGPHTKKELEGLGYRVDYMPDISNSDKLAGLIEGLIIGRLLYPASDISNNRLSDLKNVDTFVVYRTEALSPPKVDLGDYAGVIFSSPSTVDSFLTLYGKIPSNLDIYVYGKKTLGRLEREGYGEKAEILKIEI